MSSASDDEKFRCQGITGRTKQRCRRKVYPAESYCRYHHHQQSRRKMEQKENDAKEQKERKTLDPICPICMESCQDKPFQCGHYAHQLCQALWGKAQCSYCRQPISLSEIQKAFIEKNEELRNYQINHSHIRLQMMEAMRPIQQGLQIIMRAV